MTALTLFEVRRAAQRRVVPVALLLFTATLALGYLDRFRASGAASGSELFGAAYLLGVILLMRFGLASDRALRFDEYLIANHLRPGEYLFAKAAAMGGVLLAFGVLAVMVEVVLSGGGLPDAMWRAALWTLTAWLFAPLAMAVEASFDTSLPAAPVLLVYTVVVLAEFLSMRTLHSAEILGIRHAVIGDWGSLGPLALRSLVGAPIGFVAVGWMVALRSRRY